MSFQSISAGTLKGDKVVNAQEEDLGTVEEIMIDITTGRVAYVVLSFGGFLGMGEKFFAIPWGSLTVDLMNKRVVLNVDKERLKNAPGFDKDNWPDTADNRWLGDVYDYYGMKRYW